jgi:hypothetical protein
MAHLEFSKEITALLVIDPYNEFKRISTDKSALLQPTSCLPVIRQSTLFRLVPISEREADR